MDEKPDLEKNFAYIAAIVFMVVVMAAIVLGFIVLTRPQIETGIQSNIVTNL